jgi:two-component system chemotaxis response regulator CheB
MEQFKRVVAIASSTGGPKALRDIFVGFPQDFPAALLVVQHMTKGFLSGLADSLNAQCHIEVRLATNGCILRPGVALLAPDDYHLVIQNGGIVRLDSSPPIRGHRPSAEPLFASVAQVCREKAIGVVLTGMGSDGVQGIGLIKEAGGITIAQDESTSVVFGMPKASIELGVIDRILPLEEIGPEILRLLDKE